jgi:hypothetical protein
MSSRMSSPLPSDGWSVSGLKPVRSRFTSPSTWTPEPLSTICWIARLCHEIAPTIRGSQ